MPSDGKRPCEMCYCIKGFRKCVIKKCAPLIRGCTPRVPKEGNCCPTSYDCSRSLKVVRQVNRQIRQSDDDEAEEDNDSIDFFSLLFGSDEPTDESTAKVEVTESTTLQPFKALPTTEKSFFDLIRAGLEIIDANADKIDSSLNDIATTERSIPLNTTEATTMVRTTPSTTEKLIETSPKTTRATTTTRRPDPPRSTAQSPVKLPATTKPSTPKLVTTTKPSSTTTKRISTTVKSSTVTGMRSFQSLSR